MTDHGTTPARPGDHFYMLRALHEARLAAEKGEVPVGAIAVHRGEIVAVGGNQTITDCDPTAHAEVVALRALGRKLGNYRTVGVTLYVTLEPCVMCAGAMVHARVGRLVFGASDPKTGALGGAVNLMSSAAVNHRFDVTAGVLGTECGDLLRTFFRERRQ
ncbi:MAG: tRNA adenosine(34) deaminase TadA [Pseudomonadota bacterium]